MQSGDLGFPSLQAMSVFSSEIFVPSPGLGSVSFPVLGKSLWLEAPRSKSSSITLGSFIRSGVLLRVRSGSYFLSSPSPKECACAVRQ